MTLMSDTKFEEKLTWGLENDMRNMENFQKRREEYGTLRFWWDPFIQSREYMSLIFTEELWAHFEQSI